MTNQTLDPELERILTDLKRTKGALTALEDRVIRYLATKESQAHDGERLYLSS